MFTRLRRAWAALFDHAEDLSITHSPFPRPMDPEARALDVCAAAIEHLSLDARHHVLTRVWARYVVKPQQEKALAESLEQARKTMN